MRVYIVLLMLVILSCNSNSRQKVDDTKNIKEESNVVNEDINDGKELSEINDDELEEYHEESILFSKYEVEALDSFTKAPLDFKNNEAAWMFRTRIKDAYQSDKIDFAGYYISVLFGCGTGCIDGFIMDTRDGKIHRLPLGEDSWCADDIDRAVYRPDSRLIISAICREWGKGETYYIYYIAYLWNEESKKFIKVEKEDFLGQ